MTLSVADRDTLHRIDARLRGVEAALQRAFRDGGTAALGADLRFLGVAEISIDGAPLEQIGEQMAHKLTRELNRFRKALDRALAEIEEEPAQ